MSEIDPLSNLISFTKAKREPSMEMVRSNYSSCRHNRVSVSEERREVTCRDCKTLLDAFQVLWEMAVKERRWLYDLEEWEGRRDSLLGERYDREWQKRQGEVIAPPENPALREIWETFHACLGDKFCAMFQRKARKTKGPLWYGRDARGSLVSLEYARMLLIPKIVAKDKP